MNLILQRVQAVAELSSSHSPGFSEERIALTFSSSQSRRILSGSIPPSFHTSLYLFPSTEVKMAIPSNLSSFHTPCSLAPFGRKSVPNPFRLLRLKWLSQEKSSFNSFLAPRVLEFYLPFVESLVRVEKHSHAFYPVTIEHSLKTKKLVSEWEMLVRNLAQK